MLLKIQTHQVLRNFGSSLKKKQFQTAFVPSKQQQQTQQTTKVQWDPKDLELDLDGAMALPELLQDAAVANCL